MNRQTVGLLASVDRFLFHSCDPRICVAIRIAYAILLIISASVLMLDASVWLSDAGVLTAESAKQLSSVPQWSLLYLLPSTPAVVTICVGILLAHCVLLLLGVFSRVQAVCIYVWLTSIQHRNPLIYDGEDTVFRLLAFLMIFMPLDYAYSLSKCWLQARRDRVDDREREPQNAGLSEEANPVDPRESAWALRLVQFEVTAIYFSTAWCKWQGATWRDGSALFYVSRMDDAFGRLWLPEFLFDTPSIVHLMTWSVLVVETLLPFALWLPATRKCAIVVGVLLHLAIEYSMHLFLFEWIMIVSLLAFVRPSEWRPRHKMKRLRSSSSQICSNFSST